MPLADYQVELLNWDGEIVRVFDPTAFYDLRYSRALNDVGIVAITFPYSATLLADLNHVDYFIEVHRTHPVTNTLVREETYLTRLLHRFREGNEERIIAGGLSLTNLLARRVIVPFEDPLAAGGYSTKAGPADVVMRDYIREQAADLASPLRSFPNMTVAPIEGNGQGIGKRLRYTNLLDELKTMALQARMDFRIERATGNNLVVKIEVIGRDYRKSTNYPSMPWYGLDPARGDILNPSLMIDNRELGNFVYAMGQGQEETRLVFPAWADTIADSPYNLCEFTEDASNSEKDDPLSLYTTALEAVKAHRTQREFTYDTTGGQPGNMYRLDWDLGDRITITWDTEEQELRVTSVEISIDSTGETVKPTVIKYE